VTSENIRISVPWKCDREGCALKAAAIIKTIQEDMGKGEWVGLCLRHMTILVLVSTADSMEPLEGAV
jgi:hypothetical protein